MSTSTLAARMPLGFSPGLAVQDPLAAHWLRQVTLRLRREVCWLWRERGVLAGLTAPTGGTLPPFVDRLGSVLDLARYVDEKRAFFDDDTTAAYLSSLIAAELPDERLQARAARGGFTWLARELALSPMDCFALALALTANADSAAATVFAVVQNEPHQMLPTPALAQRLWDAPEDVIGLLDPTHPLVRTGVLLPVRAWDGALRVHPLIARQLLFPALPLPAALQPARATAAPIEASELELLTARLRTSQTMKLRIVPVLAPPGADGSAAAARIATELGIEAVTAAPGTQPSELAALAVLAWLRDVALTVPYELLDATTHADAPPLTALAALPLTLVVELRERAELKHLPVAHATPLFTLRPLGYEARVEAWHHALGDAAADDALARAVADCARRFRLEAPAIADIARALHALDRPLEAEDLFAACRSAVELGELAQPVTPRFARDELMLPARQTRQIEDLIQAVRALTTVHFEWGTARAWNESGISALFAGAPGTGKTMAAEVIAAAVGMPLFRIDLSQVVNKYIGETEKNLRRLFDAADAADVILFFDEADALFGKRTEVRDAHDRYANLEVSYLLERMERFKGVAILATNRKKDLDEAFLRRLRYLIEFPLPSAEERLRIWRSVIPPAADATGLDLAFLAERFPLAGGHIRSIVFDACLQSAERGTRRLELPTVLRSVRRELDKLGRAISLEQFAPHAAALED